MRFTTFPSGFRSFREVLECSAGFQGVAPAPVRPVRGTHDSGGISPAAPVLCSAESFSGRQRVRARGEGEIEREERGTYRDVGTSH